MYKGVATICRIIAAILVFCGMATNVAAQNNPYHIDDRLYPLYQRAYQLRKSADCLPLADSLRRAAVAIGDRHGELNALSISFLHEFYKKDNQAAVDRTIRPLIDQARKYGLWSYYYYALSNKISYYVREHRYIEAFLALDEQTAMARRQNNRRGIYRSYRMQGVIQQYRSELSQAIACFRQAAEYGRANIERYNEAIDLNSICDCYRMMGDNDRMYATALESIQRAATQATRNEATRYAAYAAFMQGRDDEFRSHYEYVLAHEEEGENASSVMRLALRAAEAMADRRYDDAMVAIASMGVVSSVESKRLHAECYRRQGDKVRCLEYMQRLLDSHYAMDERIAQYDVASKDRIFRDQHVEAERQRIQNANTRLRLDNVQATLRNSSLELGQARDAAQLARAASRRDSLLFSHQRLRERQLRSSLAAQTMAQQAEHRRIRTERAVLLSAMALAMIGLFMTLAYALYRRRATARLRATNEQLAQSVCMLNDALYRARTSERMKTMFLQNMGPDLRAPLDDIARSAHSLVDEPTDADTRRTLSARIADASEKLISQVRSILDQTDRQSAAHTAKTLLLAMAMAVATSLSVPMAAQGAAARYDTERMARLYADMRAAFAKPSNLDGLEKAMRPLMDYALRHGQMEYFYSAVSHKTTYLTNRGQYAEAFAYQDEMLDYARRHGHNYGIIMGHISLGNVYRKRMQMPQAVGEYEQAIDGYRQYGISHDLGIDYKRIVECYVIAGLFDRAAASAAQGLAATTMPRSVGGLHGYRAFAMYMLGRDADFDAEYAKYASHAADKPDILPFVANCLRAMRLMRDGRADEANEYVRKGQMGAFRTYVEIAFAKRRGDYGAAAQAMRRMNISLYGDSKGSYATEWARMSAEIGNNLAELDRQRAAGTNARLELKAAQLELRRTELELTHQRDAEHLAAMAADARRMARDNSRMRLRQLTDSLAYQRMLRDAEVQEARAGRITLGSVTGVVLALALMGVAYLVRNRRMARRLDDANARLRHTLDHLAMANAEAQASDRAKTRFIQNMSHEIRTPLNAIVGFAQLLAADEGAADGDEARQMRRIVGENTHMLQALMDSALDLTDIESGHYAMRSEPTDVAEACREAVEATRYRCAEGVRLMVDCRLPDGYAIVSDHRRVVQAMSCLLSNAMKNTASGSISLACSVDEHARMLTLAVSDTGIGVPSMMHEAIFERFRKVDEFKQGVGLGLNIARAIARRLGGDLDIDRSYGPGARFCMTIATTAPLVGERAAAEELA